MNRSKSLAFVAGTLNGGWFRRRSDLTAPSIPVPRSDRQPNFLPRLAAILLLVHLLAVMALAASPHLHHWVHPDADADDHDCAVVLFLHGGSDAAPGPVVVPGFVGAWATTLAVALPRPAFVPSVFAAGSVFEHAPPATA